VKVFVPNPEYSLVLKEESDQETVSLCIVDSVGKLIAGYRVLSINSDGKVYRTVNLDKEVAKKLGIQLDDKGSIVIAN
jgi:hypothetical protein